MRAAVRRFLLSLMTTFPVSAWMSCGMLMSTGPMRPSSMLLKACSIMFGICSTWLGLNHRFTTGSAIRGKLSEWGRSSS
ncbi:hypothetical protein D9M70_559580 [compost metagenome]